MSVVAVMLSCCHAVIAVIAVMLSCCLLLWLYWYHEWFNIRFALPLQLPPLDLSFMGLSTMADVQEAGAFTASLRTRALLLHPTPVPHTVHPLDVDPRTVASLQPCSCTRRASALCPLQPPSRPLLPARSPPSTRHVVEQQQQSPHQDRCLALQLLQPRQTCLLPLSDCATMS
jgi:hypothetical protein